MAPYILLWLAVFHTCHPALLGELATALYNSRRRQWHPTPVLLPGKSHERRSLVGCSLWGREESDTTERLHFHFSLSCIGEGNGSPLESSCLENPRDRGAWWAAIYGVTQGQTRLKWLSSYTTLLGGDLWKLKSAFSWISPKCLLDPCWFWFTFFP